MQQIKFILLPQRHDVEDANAQRSDVLKFRLFGFNPGNPVAFNRLRFCDNSEEE
jgi:hypothetical protein